MIRTAHRILRGFGTLFTVMTVLLAVGVAQEMPKTTQEQIKGGR